MSIHRNLVAGLLLGLMVLLAISGTLLYFYVNTVLAHQFDAALQAEAHAICSLIKLNHNGKVEMEDILQGPMPQFSSTVRPQYFQVWSEDGSALVRSPALGTNDLPYTAAAEKPQFVDIELPQRRPGKALIVRFVAVAEKDEEDKDDAKHKSTDGKAMDGKAIANRDKEHKDNDDNVSDGGARNEATMTAVNRTVTVAVAQDRSELHRITTVLFSALLVIAALAALGTVAVVSFVVQRGLRPLDRVAYEAAHIDAQSLTFRFSLDGLPNELQPICLRLNDSLERLQQAFQRQQRFTADAAHELRTPIAELRSLADVALKWDGDRETSLGYFKDAQEIAQQMEGIVTTLLSLARCQSGTAAVARDSVDLIELLNKAWDGHRQETDERHLATSFDLPKRLVLETDRTMLYSMVNNLLANAAQHTRFGGTVTCKAEVNGSAMRFSVINETDGLSTDDLPHLLEAFWRKDTARSDGLHCGLGLTLMDAYATALGGKVEIGLPKPDLLCVTVILPARV